MGTKDFKRVVCPVCGRLLCRASVEARGRIEVLCERCKKPREVDISNTTGAKQVYNQREATSP